VAPKAHYPDLYTAPEALLVRLIVAVKKLAIHYNDRIGSSGVNVLHASGVPAQQSVPHLHIHLIPRFDDDGLDTWPKLPALQVDKDELLEKLLLRA
jgi:histidine triad (HIT) family protein